MLGLSVFQVENTDGDQLLDLRFWAILFLSIFLVFLGLVRSRLAVAAIYLCYCQFSASSAGFSPSVTRAPSMRRGGASCIALKTSTAFIQMAHFVKNLVIRHPHQQHQISLAEDPRRQPLRQHASDYPSGVIALPWFFAMCWPSACLRRATQRWRCSCCFPWSFCGALYSSIRAIRKPTQIFLPLFQPAVCCFPPRNTCRFPFGYVPVWSPALACCCVASGFFLSMAERTWPFVFLLLPVLLLCAYQALRRFWRPFRLFFGSGRFVFGRVAHVHRGAPWPSDMSSQSGFNLYRAAIVDMRRGSPNQRPAGLWVPAVELFQHGRALREQPTAAKGRAAIYGAASFGLLWPCTSTDCRLNGPPPAPRWRPSSDSWLFAIYRPLVWRQASGCF